jgi:hypothetical protein
VVRGGGNIMGTNTLPASYGTMQIAILEGSDKEKEKEINRIEKYAHKDSLYYGDPWRDRITLDALQYAVETTV